ncbi:MAG: methyl-accepting chemotaxis protein [Neomegalonema sp.]|nr:methyl-accepting chemotaxis protein [Neomegalonema sp.]
MNGLTIKTKTLIAFILIGLVTLTAGSASLWLTNSARSSIDHGQHLRGYAEKLLKLKSLATEQDLTLQGFILTGDRAHLKALLSYDDQVKTAIADVKAHLAARQESSGADRAAVAAIAAAWSSWRTKHVAKVVKYMRQPRTIDLARLEQSSGAHLADLVSFFKQIDGVEAKLSEALSQSATAQMEAIGVSQTAALVGMLAVLGLTTVLGFVTYSIIARIARTMKAMEAGEVDAMTANLGRKDEIGAMARASNAFREKLADIARAEKQRVASEHAAEEARRAMLDRLRSEFGMVVGAAVEGDFSARINTRFDDETLNELAGGVNSLLASVEAGVSETKRVATSLAQGNLTATMQGDFRGAFAELQSSLNAAMAQLDELVGDIVNGVALTERATDGIQHNAEELARRSENQASSIQETAATMEEMTATIRSNAENASTAREVAQQAATRARVGGEVVGETRGAIDRIEASASKIAEITSVIDSIAFQTNLLALNAAVEAARAGEAGKGFAVVASEVRDLAHRSATAAKDISALVSESSDNVHSGVELARRTGEALEQIVEAVDQVENYVADIAAANREQSSGVEEISSAIGHIDQLTQQSAALAEESASHARSLAQQSEQLSSSAAVFATSADRSRMSAVA